MTKTNYNPKVDTYIANVQPFAEPVLNHLRELVHTGCLDVDESIKWGMPFFEHRGKSIGQICLSPKGTKQFIPPLRAVGTHLPEIKAPEGRRTLSVLSSIPAHISDRIPHHAS